MINIIETPINTFNNAAAPLTSVMPVNSISTFDLCSSTFSLRSVEATSQIDAYSTDESDTNEDNVILSKVVNVNENGSFTLTLESYATGTSSTVIQVPIPSDIILVMDESGSMNDCIECGHEMTDKCDSFSFDSKTGVATGHPVYANSVDKTKTYKIVYKDSTTKYSERTLVWCDKCQGWYSSSVHSNHLPAGGGLYSWTPFNSASDTADYSRTDGDGYHVQYYCNCGDNHTETRKQVLQAATTEFLNNVYANAIGKDGDEDNVDNRIAIVGYGNDNPARIYTIDGTRNHTLTETTAQNAFKSAITEQSIINTGLSNLKDSEATATNRGMEAADMIFEYNPVGSDEMRNRVVILFTDGSPGSGYYNDIEWANGAIQHAYNIKQSGGTVYTIGLFSGADGSDPKNLPEYDVDANGVTNPQFFANGNRFLHLVSSNYPNATSLDDIGEVASLQDGEGYYLSTDNKEGLFSIFGKLANVVKAGGTSVELDNSAVVMDVVSKYFQIPDGADNITAWTETFMGGQNWSKDVDSISTVDSGILDIEVDDNTVTVTNFDFAENYVATDKDINNQDVYRGKKLVLEVEIQPSNEFNSDNMATNEPTSGIYVPDENGDYVATKIFDVPTIQPSEEWGENVDGDSYSGVIKLSQNTTINGKISVENGSTLIIDLNGYVLQGDGQNNLFEIAEGGTLLIIDSNPYSVNYGTIDDDGVWSYTGDETGTIINGGVITNGHSVESGGAACVYGKLVLNGGTIAGNKSNTNGGAIYIDGGTFVMNNSSIYYNKTEYGGAIYVSSGNIVFGTEECYMNGYDDGHTHPIISNNISLNGESIYIENGAVTMWCGEIKYNHTYDKTETIHINGGVFDYYSGIIGIPYDTGINIANGNFNDNTIVESEDIIKSELHYHSILVPDGQGNDINYNSYIPKSKWITSSKGIALHKEDSDDTTPTWADLFPEYEFVGWENKPENDTDEVVNLYAIWEEK